MSGDAKKLPFTFGGPSRAREEAAASQKLVTKRKRGALVPDESLFCWLNRPIPASFTIAHQSVRDQVANVALDVDWALHKLRFSSAPKPNHRISDRLWRSIMLDEYVDLDWVLSENSFSTITEKEHTDGLLLEVQKGGVKIRSAEPEKRVSSPFDWLRSFLIYEDAVNFHFTGRAREMKEYREHITDLFTMIRPEIHSRVFNYDKAVRKYAGQKMDILLFETRKFEKFDRAFLSEIGVAADRPAHR